RRLAFPGARWRVTGFPEPGPRDLGVAGRGARPSRHPRSARPPRIDRMPSSGVASGPMQPKDTLSRSRRVIPVVLMYSLATACGAVQALPVQAPDLVNPVCMSTVVGRGATLGTRTIGPLANRLSAEQTSYATGAGSASRSKTVSVFQENVLEQV